MGTRAQVIKLAPVIREIEARGIELTILLTGQHRATVGELLHEFGISREPVVLYDGPEVESLGRVVPWFMRAARAGMRAVGSRRAAARHERDVFLVHGDTFSTLLGIWIGRRAGGLVAHVESGLRSFNWLNPFPEELVRRLSMSSCDIAFAPGEWAAGNLARCRGRVIDTHENTLVDAVRFAVERSCDTQQRRADVVVSIHRFETLYSRKRIVFVVDFVLELARDREVTFVLHPSTEHRLKTAGLMSRLRQQDNIWLRPRMTYVPFLGLAGHARLVITDGGSNQEELSYLGVPTILMRERTERREGLGANVLLGKFDLQRMQAFAREILGGTQTGHIDLPKVEPSRIVVDALILMSPTHGSASERANRGGGAC